MALRLAEGHLSGQGALALILDYAAYASPSEVPGLVAAVASILHADEMDAHAVVGKVRRDARRARHTTTLVH